jgi:hypothetical protein
MTLGRLSIVFISDAYWSRICFCADGDSCDRSGSVTVRSSRPSGVFGAVAVLVGADDCEVFCGDEQAVARSVPAVSGARIVARIETRVLRVLRGEAFDLLT